MADTISINIDDKDYEVTAGQQLIEALREVGIDTPNFCYHPDLSIAGNCRICLAEVEGPRGWALMISCHMPIRPGLKVRTQLSSDRVRTAREGVMEFLLVNHPLDCPICDKAGECMLQEHYMSSGAHESRLHDEVGKVYKGGVDHRFTDTKGIERGGKQIDIGPEIVLDQERCILCSRCVRFMDEVAGDEQLYIAGRGDHAYITTFPGDQLEHDYDLCTTDVCPVGALTGKHFRFQQRVWFLKSIDSINPFDSLGANITIDFNKDTVWRIMPRRNPDVNKSWIANEHRLVYQDLNENRLITGLVKGEEATLGDAYIAAGEAIKNANKVAIVANGQLTVEDNAGLLAFAKALGDKATVFGGSWLSVGEADGIARSGDPVGNRRGLEALGIEDNLDALANSAADYDCLVVLGQDLWADNAEQAKKLETIEQRVVLASWKTATVEQATVAIGIRSWAEARGTMINVAGRLQMLNACPVCPNQDMDPAWHAFVRLSGQSTDKPLPWISEIDAWKSAQAIVPALSGLSYRHIGSMGVMLELPETVEASA